MGRNLRIIVPAIVMMAIAGLIGLAIWWYVTPVQTYEIPEIGLHGESAVLVEMQTRMCVHYLLKDKWDCFCKPSQEVPAQRTLRGATKGEKIEISFDGNLYNAIIISP